MKRNKNILSVVFLLLTIAVNGQDTTLFIGDTMFVSPNTIMTVVGNTVNNGPFENHGDVVLNGSIRNRVGRFNKLTSRILIFLKVSNEVGL